MTIYKKKINLSSKSFESLLKMIKAMEGALPNLQKAFIRRSLDYLDLEARKFLESSTGNGSYVPTGELMSHFQKDYDTGRFFNDCFYASYVEFGTGIVGSGTHPASGGYQYDVNNHGEDGWYYFGKDGVIYWTKGMEAHRYMYNALNAYIHGGMKICFSKAFDEVMGGIING